MRRVLVVLTSAVLVTAIGCGKENYDKRLEKTIEKMKYDRRLKQNLMPEPSEKKFHDLAIFIRPPKEEALAKTSLLSVGEGQFDLDASFIDKTDSVLHLLARVKQQKKPAAKGAPPVAPPPPRAEFVGEVLGVISTFSSADALQTPKFVEENKKGNRFKRLIFTTNDGKEAKLYTYKEGNHEVALIFVYDPKVKGLMANKIDLCLDSFATGQKATRLYSGGSEEEPESSPNGPV